MRVTKGLILTGVSMFLAGASAAFAGSDVFTPPPLVLSPDLTEPWITQLRPANYRDVLTTPPVAPYPHEAPIGLWRAPPPQAGARPQPLETSVQPGMQVLNPQSDGSRLTHVANADPDEASRTHTAPEFLPTEVAYSGPYKPGTLVINTSERHLYLVETGGRALRYGVGVGRPGFEWAGEHTVTRKAEWPDWTPPEAMLKRQPKLPHHMDGGPNNPLGARALYLGSTEYRIHGTSEPWTIGHAVSSGCIRMRNEDVEDLYERVKVGTKVIVL